MSTYPEHPAQVSRAAGSFTELVQIGSRAIVVNADFRR